MGDTQRAPGQYPGRMATIVHLTLEILDRILFALDPLDIARVSQTCRFFYEIIYGPLDQQFWRGLYLAQALDDPRKTVTRLGRRRRDDIDWKGELQRITRARTVIKNPDVCRQEERVQVLQTCLSLMTNLLPIASPNGEGEMSRNVLWMEHTIGDGAFLERESWEELSEEEEQLLARLHVLYGLTRRHLTPERRRACQAFVYSLRNHTPQRSYGPFMPDGSKRVDWVFLSKFVFDLAMLLVDMEDENTSSYFCPMGLLCSQSIIPRGLDLDKEDDWAGMEGLWSVRYGFMDHREFILYNDPSVPDHEPQDTAIFDDTEETLATLDIYIRVSGTEPDPSHPTRPQINIIGEVDGKFNIVGFVKLTEDDQVWCHYGAGNDNQMVWHCDAIGLGNIRSQCGFMGVWSTVFHDVEDPIGSFWMQRELLTEDE